MAAKKEKDLAKKSFNAVAKGLFRELGKLFPGDVAITFLSEELDKFSKNKADAHVPAIKFFKSLGQPSGVQSLAADGEIAPVGELIINKDERLFTEESATVSGLDAINFKVKWAQLSAENKVLVWGYLDRMASCSAKVATLEALKSEDLAALSRLMSGAPKDVAQLMKDPAVLELVVPVGERVG